MDAATFWDKAARKYAASPISDQAAYEATLEKTRAHLRQDMQVLEIGAGTGGTALLLADSVGHLTSTDISTEMMKIATEKAAAEGVKNVTFEVRSAAQAAERAKDYQAVLALNILHLVEDAQGLVATLAKELEPGALVISKTGCIADPSVGILRFALRLALPVMQMIGKAPFVHFFTFAQVEALFTDAGFEIVETATGPKMSRYVVARRR